MNLCLVCSCVCVRAKIKMPVVNENKIVACAKLATNFFSSFLFVFPLCDCECVHFLLSLSVCFSFVTVCAIAGAHLRLFVSLLSHFREKLRCGFVHVCAF